ncbi:MAG: hypothetical protein Tsb0020_47170 [Haliangiales bacterium]
MLIAVLGPRPVAAEERATPRRVDHQRVVLVAFSPALDEATKTALRPWQTSFTSVAQPLPGARAQAVARARTLAVEHDAAVVVWLSEAPSEPALTIYDVANQRLMTRPLPSPPPYDAPTAAALALALKTTLRHSQVAPERERSQEPPAAQVTELRELEEAPAPVAARPVYEASVGVTAALAPTATRPEDGLHAAARVAFGIGWWPALMPAGLGVGGSVELGAGQMIESSGFSGHLSDIDADLTVRWRAWHSPSLELIASAGAGLRRASLSGTVQPDSITLDERRWLPELGLGLAARMPLTRFASAGLQVGTKALLRTAEFRLPEALPAGRADRLVAETARFSLQVGAVLLLHR